MILLVLHAQQLEEILVHLVIVAIFFPIKDFLVKLIALQVHMLTLYQACAYFVIILARLAMEERQQIVLNAKLGI